MTLRRRLVKIAVALVICLLLAASGISAWAVTVSAQAAAVLDGTGGFVLFEKNSSDKLPMASTTKVMTALLAIERGDLDEVVKVDPGASGVEGSSIYLEPGENITLRNLLYGLMLWSGNDAAIAIAIHIGTSVENFVALMNARATEIGAKNTHFTNPNGLPDSDHYTTAYDLALITYTAMQNQEFAKIVGTKQHTMGWEGHEYDRVMTNSNKLLRTYDWVTGVKTGFTKAAGRCLVTSAEKDGKTVVSVVLNAPDMYDDSVKLLEYGLDQLVLTTVLTKGDYIGRINILNGAQTDLEVLAENDIVLPVCDKFVKNIVIDTELVQNLEAPVEIGQIVGVVTVSLEGRVLAQRELTAAKSVRRLEFADYLHKLINSWLEGWA